VLLSLWLDCTLLLDEIPQILQCFSFQAKKGLFSFKALTNPENINI